MPKQTYDLYTKDAYDCMVAYVSEPYIIISGSADTDINVGTTLTNLGATEGLVRIDETGRDIFGIAVRVANYETSTRPSDGSYYYPKGSSIAILRQGTFYHLATTAIVRGSGVTSSLTGALTGFVGAGGITNIEWLESGAIGDLVLARIDIEH